MSSSSRSFRCCLPGDLDFERDAAGPYLANATLLSDSLVATIMISRSGSSTVSFPEGDDNDSCQSVLDDVPHNQNLS